MKRNLTKEQSAQLIELGVPREKASAIEQIPDYDYPIFTVADLLEILPKEIKGCGVRNVIFYPTWRVEMAFYDRTGMIPCKSKELIDALYKLLCWVIEYGYLKL